MSTREHNRKVASFLHQGKPHKIMERTNFTSDGNPCTRRFIVRVWDDTWQGEANNVREARKVLAERSTREWTDGIRNMPVDPPGAQLTKQPEAQPLLPRSRFDIGCALIEAAGLLFAAAEPLLRKCQWSEDEDGNWDTACNETFEFTTEGPKENKFKFCPFCGGELIAVKHPTPSK